jgi:hypothetical protein
VDIDGVLNGTDYDDVIDRLDARQFPMARYADRAVYRSWVKHIDPRAMKLLNRVLSATGAMVVLCSSWRHYHPLRRLRRMLRDAGLKGRVIGITPTLKNCFRGEECVAWMALARASWSVRSFVALDDMDDYDPMKNRLVKTSKRLSWGYYDGLQKSHVERAIDLLQVDTLQKDWCAAGAKLLRHRVHPELPHMRRLLRPHEANGIVRGLHAQNIF